MKYMCILQGETVCIAQNMNDAKRILTDWLDDGYHQDEIELYPASKKIPFTVESTFLVTVKEDRT